MDNIKRLTAHGKPAPTKLLAQQNPEIWPGFRMDKETIHVEHCAVYDHLRLQRKSALAGYFSLAVRRAFRAK